MMVDRQSCCTAAAFTALVLLTMGIGVVHADSPAVSNLQPVVTLCDSPGSFGAGTRCAAASRCKTFFPSGDLGNDVHADTCYWGSRFAPVLGDHFALELLCPLTPADQKAGEWCATLVVDDSEADCLANWASKTQDQRRELHNGNASSVQTMNVVCNQCQYRAGRGWWMLQCPEPSNIPTSAGGSGSGFNAEGVDYAIFQSGCDELCHHCTSITPVASDLKDNSNKCLPMNPITGDRLNFATLLTPTFHCEWAGVSVFLPDTRPYETSDWNGKCNNDFNKSTTLAGFELMIDSGCLPLPGYSTLEVGPTISVQCKPYDVKWPWANAPQGGNSEASPEEKGSLGIMVILLIVAIAAIALVAFFIVKSQRRVAQMEAERSAYLHMHETHASTQDHELTRAQQQPPRAAPHLRDPPAVEPRGYDFLPRDGDGDEETVRMVRRNPV